MAEHKDKIKGGLADKKKPSDFNPKALKEGKKVESEHTDDKSVAQEIAMDHLTEDKKYYKKLKEVEDQDDLEKGFKNWAAGAAIASGIGLAAPTPAHADYQHVHQYISSMKDKVPGADVKSTQSPGMTNSKISFGKFNVRVKAILGGKSGISNHKIDLMGPKAHESTWSDQDHKDFQHAKIVHQHLSDKLPVLMDMSKPKAKKSSFEKKDMIEVTADGKQEIVEGNEPLKLKKKWKDLKKGLNNLESIMDLAAASQPDEQPQEEQQEVDPEMSSEQDDSQPQDQDSDSMQNPPSNEMDENTQPEMEEGEGDIDETAADEQPESDEGLQENNPDYQSEESPELEQGGEAVSEEGEESSDEDSEQKIIQALKDDGYSEPEIAYIVHGHHSPAYDESKEAKAHATYAMAGVDTENARQQGQADLEAKKKQMELEHSHAARMKDLEFQHAQMQSPDPETEKNHKKRMLDLEYENAKAASPDGFDKEHQKRMMDLEYAKAAAGSPDPEIAKQMAQIDIEERKLQLEQRKEEMKMELEFKKKEHELKLKLMEENMKQKAKNQAEHGKLQHSIKMKEAGVPKKKLKKSVSEDGIEIEIEEGEEGEDEQN